MIRLISYVLCLTAFIWLGVGSLRFRESIRVSLKEATSLMYRVDPDHAGDNGKVLNSYYEDVYDNMPAIVVPACILMVGATVLLLSGRVRKAEPGTAPNGGPAARLANSGVKEGPPSVS
ncbi:MAG TPA: hypothetical protein VFD27_23105 [Chthoniobacteraceae bacterium]|jgi:hypothetical protein|nr:hypothetical protein [Chthoniobacteraceae bacterium]